MNGDPTNAQLAKTSHNSFPLQTLTRPKRRTIQSHDKPSPRKVAIHGDLAKRRTIQSRSPHKLCRRLMLF